MRKPNSKYKDFYQFLITQQYDKNTCMEINEYNTEEAKIMLMFMQKQITNTTDNTIKGICNTETYNIRKGII